jgi:hypothetical protein
MGWYYLCMNQKRLWLAATIIALVIIIGFVLSVPHTSDLPVASTSLVTEALVPEVTLRDVYKKGVHTITGSIMAPDACGTVTASASLVGSASTTQEILVAIELSDDPSVCLELPTRATFQATVTAPAQIPLSATVNGALATTTAL